MQKIADDIAIVSAGRLLTHRSVRDLVAGGRRRLRLRVDDPARAGAVLERVHGVVAVERGGDGWLGVELDRLEDSRAIEVARALVEAGVGVAELVQEQETLEQRFLDLTRGSGLDGPEATT